MAKLFIKPNPNVNPLVGFIKLEEKRTVKDKVTGTETVDREYIDKRYTRAPGTSVRLCANPSRKLHGNLNSGMLHEIVNPYKDKETFSDPRFKDVLMGREKAKAQHVLEYKHSKPFNYYTNQFIDTTFLDKSQLDKIPALMRAEYTIDLKDGTTVLDTTTEYGEIMSYILRANEQVANSYEEISGKTMFYIAAEEEEETRKQKREALKDRCVSYLVGLHDDNQYLLPSFCKALDIRKRVDNPTAAYNELKRYITRNNDNASMFKTMYEMWTEEATRPAFTARVMLYDARYHGIVLKDGPTYTWDRPNTEEGDPVESMTFDRYTGDNSIIEFLSHPKYQKEQKEMQEQINRADKYRK